MAAVVGRACQRLTERNTPHNLFIADSGARVFLFPNCFASRKATGQIPEGAPGRGSQSGWMGNSLPWPSALCSLHLPPSLTRTDPPPPPPPPPCASPSPLFFPRCRRHGHAGRPGVLGDCGDMVLKRAQDYEVATEEWAWRLLAYATCDEAAFSEATGDRAGQVPPTLLGDGRAGGRLGPLNRQAHATRHRIQSCRTLQLPAVSPFNYFCVEWLSLLLFCGFPLFSWPARPPFLHPSCQ